MEIKRVFELLDNYVEKYPNQKVALAGKKNGQWVNYSSTSYKEHSDTLSYALIELGIEKGDKVAMILTNRPEWNMLDMAISQVGAITVPVYPTISEDDYRYILHDCDAKMVIIDGLSVMNKVTNILPDAPNVKLVYTMVDREKYPYFDQLLQLGKDHPHVEELDYCNLERIIRTSKSWLPARPLSMRWSARPSSTLRAPQVHPRA